MNLPAFPNTLKVFYLFLNASKRYVMVLINIYNVCLIVNIQKKSSYKILEYVLYCDMLSKTRGGTQMDELIK